MADRNLAIPVLIGLAVFGAVVAGGLVIQKKRQEAQQAAVQSADEAKDKMASLAKPIDKDAPRPLPQWEQYIPTGRLIGPSNAALTVVEYADFQCPACKTLHDQLANLRAQYPRDFAISYHYVPLPYHEMAYPAARATECAAEQGKFEAYHDGLYARPELIEEGSFLTIAKGAGVPDLKKFSECAARKDPVPRIDDDRTTALAVLKISGTPTVLVNGQMYLYAPSMGALKQMIEDARSRAGGAH